MWFGIRFYDLLIVGWCNSKLFNFGGINKFSISIYLKLKLVEEILFHIFERYNLSYKIIIFLKLMSIITEYLFEIKSRRYVKLKGKANKWKKNSFLDIFLI